MVRLRQVTRLDKGRQVHVLTDRQAGDLPSADVIYGMGSRWREENDFRDGRARLRPGRTGHLRRHCRGPGRKVLSPAKKAAAAAVKTAKKNLAAAEAACDAKLTALRSPAPGAARSSSSPTRCSQSSTSRSPPHAASSKTPRPPPGPSRQDPLSEHNPDMVRLDTETKLITHAIRMAADNAETILARALDSGYAGAWRRSIRPDPRSPRPPAATSSLAPRTSPSAWTRYRHPSHPRPRRPL